MYLIMYDISDRKRLKQVSRLLNRYGRRVQKSVYECGIDRRHYEKLLFFMKDICSSGDRVRSYHLYEPVRSDEII